MNKRWRYDCMVYDNEGGRLCALEIAHTHFSGETKIQDTFKMEGILIAECGLRRGVSSVHASRTWTVWMRRSMT
jgi:hypothetical protein